MSKQSENETRELLNRQIIDSAINQLCASDRGADALASLNVWLSEHATGLDAKNQGALITLMRMFWMGNPMMARDAIEEAVKPRCEHGIPEGEWCDPCNKEYKRAAKAAELED